MIKGEKSIGQKISLGVAVVLCPCHLPIYFALLGGTAAGALLSKNIGITVTAMTIVFLAALVWGLRSLKAKPTSAEKEPDERGFG